MITETILGIFLTFLLMVVINNDDGIKKQDD
jgi:hypothetical protein